MSKYIRKCARRSKGSWNNDWNVFLKCFHKLIVVYILYVQQIIHMVILHQNKMMGKLILPPNLLSRLGVQKYVIGWPFLCSSFASFPLPLLFCMAHGCMLRRRLDPSVPRYALADSLLHTESGSNMNQEL